MRGRRKLLFLEKASRSQERYKDLSRELENLGEEVKVKKKATNWKTDFETGWKKPITGYFVSILVFGTWL
jgi:hypothetical protein